MLSERQIPESRIALNPVVIDDSKRGNSPENSESLKQICEAVLYLLENTHDERFESSLEYIREKAFGERQEHIEKMRTICEEL